jgi:hypothetical protein
MFMTGNSGVFMTGNGFTSLMMLLGVLGVSVILHGTSVVSAGLATMMGLSALVGLANGIGYRGGSNYSDSIGGDSDNVVVGNSGFNCRHRGALVIRGSCNGHFTVIDTVEAAYWPRSSSLALHLEHGSKKSYKKFEF